MTLIARLRTIPYLPLLTGLMVLRLITAGRAGLVPDESYYWLWAQHPALGYYDHPPMVAWWIAGFTAIADFALLVRLPFILSFAALSWLMYDTAKVLFSAAVARRTLLWLNACVLLSVGSVIATPDPPSVLMWACGLWALAKLHTTGKGWWWLVFGLFAGLGFEAKYTNLFLGVGVIAWMALDKDARRQLLTPWPYLGGLVAAAAMAPNLIWNAHHGWITFAKQFGRIESSHFTAKYLIEFLISQPLLINPLIFVFVVIGVMMWWRNRHDRNLTLLIALPLPLLAYMLVHVFHDRIQGNWPAPVYPGLIVLAAAASESVTGKWLPRLRMWAAPFGIGLSVIALVYLALGNLGPSLAGAAGLSQGWKPLTETIVEKAAQLDADWIATTDYNTQGELAHAMGADTFSPVPLVERERYGWPTYENILFRKRVLIVVAAGHTLDLAKCFNELTDQGTVSRLKKPGKKSDFRLYTGRLKYVGCKLEE